MLRLASHCAITFCKNSLKNRTDITIARTGFRALSAAFTTTASSVPKELRVCVVGSGPAGFYTVDRLLKRYGNQVHVSILDRLPTPFGLVRSGVAPDHQETKNVINQFSALAADPRVSFFGNVLVGRDVDISELRELHHAVVLAYGAESDRKLGIPGEDGPAGPHGVFSAREFVWWYNGHPDARRLPIDLSKVRAVAICGIGNVALDCARTLLAPPDRFTPTDLAAHALSQLEGGMRGAGRSGVREVHLVARRGPVQAACTPKELKELLTECGVSARTAAVDQLTVSEADAAEMKATRLKRRVFELVSKAVGETVAASSTERRQRDLFFQFYRNPVAILRGPDGAVTGLKVERTVLRPDGPGAAAVAVGSGVYDTIECQMVLKSIGYKSLPVHGVAFDTRRGVIPNVAGRVLKQMDDLKSSSSRDEAASLVGANSTTTTTTITKERNGGGPATDMGLYVVGWLKRGPTGIIGTNLVDAEETVDSLVGDVQPLLVAGQRSHGSAGPPGVAGLTALLQQRGVQVVDWRRWRLLDEHELAAGRASGRVREKVTEVPEMLKVCGFAME